MADRLAVSVIIPAFNAAKYIKEAIMSALNQTITDIEILVVDDASTDATVVTAREILDSRVSVFCMDHNSGPSACRNFGISKARGEWIAVLDADDWWDGKRLGVLLNYATQNEADIVCDDLYMVDTTNPTRRVSYLKSREGVIGPVMTPMTITPHDMIRQDFGVLQPVIRAGFLRRHGVTYKNTHRFGEDFVFLLDCLLAGATMVLYPVPYYFYRCGHTSLSTSSGNAQGQCNLLEELISTQYYSQFPAIKQALEHRLTKKKHIVEQDRATKLFSEKHLIQGLRIVLKHPKLLVVCARRIKARFHSTGQSLW